MSYGYYYIPRSPLNPHGTYAIVATEDLAVEPPSRHHLAEVSGFGDGAPSRRRQTPDQVHLFTAAPDLKSAASDMCAALSRIGDWDDGCLYINGICAPELQGPFQALADALAKAEGMS